MGKDCAPLKQGGIEPMRRLLKPLGDLTGLRFKPRRRRGQAAGRWLIVLFMLVVLAVAACQGTTEDEQPTATAEAEAINTPTEARRATDEPTAKPESTATVQEPTTTATAAEASSAAENTPMPEPAVETVMPMATAVPVESPVTGVSLDLVAGGLSRPVYLTHAFDERLFVVEKEGRIRVLQDGQLLVAPFLDISDRVGSSALEQGLLSAAFHPEYAQNGRFFVNYTNLQGNTVVAAYQVSPGDPSRAEADSERILLEIAQPYGNHNGGQLQFGPDGYLYVGMGDGGSAGDPLNNGQNPNTLLGALLRLDVDGEGTDGKPYGIPADNPYASQADAREEIWATGLRNPWRFSFDRQSGDLYVADVGQNLWEEVNFQAAGEPGGSNYGWNVMEASHCYGAESCDATGFVAPVAEYGHQGGNCSITGGYMYRGSQHPDMFGNYYFADYCSGTIWALFRQTDGGWQQTLLEQTGIVIASFGEDFQGELYILDHVNGDVYQLGP